MPMPLGLYSAPIARQTHQFPKPPAGPIDQGRTEPLTTLVGMGWTFAIRTAWC